MADAEARKEVLNSLRRIAPEVLCLLHPAMEGDDFTGARVLYGLRHCDLHRHPSRRVRVAFDQRDSVPYRGSGNFPWIDGRDDHSVVTNNALGDSLSK